MLIIEKYIARSIFFTTAMSALVVTGILLLVDLLAELRNIGEGDYGFTQALLFVLMRLPMEIYQFAPILVLLGCIAGLSILSSTRELAVMRVSGFSIKRVLKSLVMAVGWLLLVLCFVGEYFAPKLSYVAEINKEYAKNAGQAVVTSTGLWLHIDRNFIHIENMVDRNNLEDVTRYEFDEQHHLKAAYFIKSLVHEKDHWIMHDVVKTLFYPNRTKVMQMAQGEWDLQFNTHALGGGWVDASIMSLGKLVRYIRFLKHNGLQASEYQYELCQRLLQPLAILIMVFLACPFVLGTFSVTTTGRRLLVGVLVGFAFYILKACLGQLSIVYQIPPLLAALFPLIIFALLSLFLIRKLLTR